MSPRYGHPTGDVLAALQNSERTFLECRDFGHAWTHITDYLIGHTTADKPGFVERTVRCTRCSCERHDRYHLPDFTRLSSKYAHPSGYVLKGSNGHVPKAEVRKIMFELFYRSIDLTHQAAV